MRLLCDLVGERRGNLQGECKVGSINIAMFTIDIFVLIILVLSCIDVGLFES